MPVHLAVAGDYPLVIAGLHAVLKPFSARVLLSQPTGGSNAPPLDVVLYDPAADQVGPPSDLRAVHDGDAPKLVVFSWLDDPHRVNAAHACGADAQISKTLSPEELVDSIERIQRGERIGMGTTGPASSARDVWPGAEHGLSGRESEVLMYICQGLSNQEIAGRAFIGINTVKTYIRSCYRKLGVETRPQAVIWAMANGFAGAQRVQDPASVRAD